VEKIGTSMLFENNHIRIWTLLLEPGETAPVHQHPHPYVYVVVAPGETEMREADGNVVRQHDERWQVVRHDEGLPHSLQNIGTTRYENIIIELKTEGASSETAGSNTDVLVADWLATFAPGDAADLLRAHLGQNPGRISRGYGELLQGHAVGDPDALLKITRTLSPEEPRPGWVTVDGIEFVSMCPHHFLPYTGLAEVSYRPQKVILGLGKIPRYVDALARRLVIQEDLTQAIASGIGRVAGTEDVKVTTTAVHTCISRRGARQSGSKTTVACTLGE
jgi:GTP cyclohydrolase IA